MKQPIKFELTGESKVNLFGVTVHRIRATEDIPRTSIKKGDEGGWVEGTHLVNGDARVSGDAWVYGNAQVYGNARVYGDAWVYGNARVSGNARVYGDAWVSGDAWVYGNAQVYGNARVSGNARVYGDAWVSGDAWVYGNAQVYGNARVYGNAQVQKHTDFLLVGPIGSESVWATLFRTKTGHTLNVGCWRDGSLGTLMAEVKRRREYWHGDDAQKEIWMAQYRALKALGKATVAQWAIEAEVPNA